MVSFSHRRRMLMHMLMLMLVMSTVLVLSASTEQRQPNSEEALSATTVIDLETFSHGTSTAHVTRTLASAADANTSEAAEGEDNGHEDDHPYYAVLLPWFATALGIVVFYVQSRHLQLVPYTCVMFIIGLCMGVGAVRSGLDDQLTISIAQWTGIHHETLFVTFLPGLLMKDALELNFHLFVASFWQVMILAFPMVLAGTMLTALVAFYIFPYDWSFMLSMTLGGILSATDPVAVCGLMNELGAPPRLKMLISGESLMNDGSAVVFYTIFSQSFLYELGVPGLGSQTSVANGFVIFFRMALGGTAVGIAFGLALVVILFYLDRRYEKEEVVLQVTATVTMGYLSFYTSEVVCRMSGVIAVVMCGVVTSAFGNALISDWVVMDSFWSLLEHLLNTVIFTLGGIEFGTIIADPNGNWTGRDWGYLLLLFVLVNAIRLFLLVIAYPCYSRIGLGTNRQEMIFSSWAGLRGALGIALALGLHNSVLVATDDPDKLNLTNKVFGMVGGIAFLTLTINAPLSAPLLKKLGLIDSTEARKNIVKQVEEATRRRMLDDFLHLMTDPRFYFVDFALVMHHCPPLRDLTAKELEDAVEANRVSVHPDLYKAPNLKHVLPYVPDSSRLRWVVEKAARDMLMDPTNSRQRPGGGGDTITAQAFFDLEVAGDVTSASPPKEQPNTELVKSIRLMFVELLRAAYQAQIRDGELDPREFSGYLSYVLLQGLDFAHDAAQNGEPLNDWKMSTGLSTRIVYKSQDLFARLYRFCCAKQKKVETGEGSLGAEGSGSFRASAKLKGVVEDRMGALQDTHFKHQQMRLDVLRAFSFIDAHCEAEDRLQDEFGDDDATKPAFRVVMEESRAQVRKANAILTGKNKKELKHVISHYLCVILQNKRARYVKVLLDSGVLLQREARHYLEEIDQSIIEIRSSPMDSYPPGIIVTATEEEDTEAEGKTARRRRKRVKQKSLL